MLTHVYCGFQTGVDIAGAVAGQRAGFVTGGWMPHGFKTLDGPRPKYAGLYGAKETTTESYSVRTGLNASLGDVTIRIARDFGSRGELCTLRYLKQYGKPYFDVKVPHDLRFTTAELEQPLCAAMWLRDQKAKTVNIAGNAEKTCPGIYSWAIRYLDKTFELYKNLIEQEVVR